jgi:hypothetical protein
MTAEQLAEIAQRLSTLADDNALYTLPEWRAKRKLSKSEYYRLRAGGLGPETVQFGPRLVRVTGKSDREWFEMMQARSQQTVCTEVQRQG